MTLRIVASLAVLSGVLPCTAAAQHSHGTGPGFQVSPRTEHKREPAATPPPGLLPARSARQIEVLVLDYGFSPSEITADVGETVTLLLKRGGQVCAGGLTIPSRNLSTDLPLDARAAVTLELKGPERLELRCRDGDATAVLVVGSP
jgi:hypothetical protein